MLYFGLVFIMINLFFRLVFFLIFIFVNVYILNLMRYVWGSMGGRGLLVMLYFFVLLGLILGVVYLNYSGLNLFLNGVKFFYYVMCFCCIMKLFFLFNLEKLSCIVE